MRKGKEEKLFYRSPKGPIYMNKMLAFPIGRAQYVHLKEPSNQSNKYELVVLYSKAEVNEDADLKKELLDLKATAEMLYAEAGLDEKLKKSITNPAFRDGDAQVEDEETGEKKDPPHPGYYYITVRSPNPIKCIGADKEEIDPSDILSGAHVKVVASPMYFSMKNAAGQLIARGISWGAKLVQLVYDSGERLYKGPQAENLVGEIPEKYKQLSKSKLVEEEETGSEEEETDEGEGTEAALDLV